jgi:16S rRNA (cytosine967-C5)-methyltransferase
MSAAATYAHWMPKDGTRTSQSALSRSDTPIRDARDAAYRHLSAHAIRYPDLIPRDINTGSLEPRDAALAIMIVEHSTRRWRTLEFILESVSGHKSHEIEPRMRAVLLGGAAQLLLLDRVPAHAVLDESVAWAKRFIRPGAGGMVNAVLRKVAQARGDHTEIAWNHHVDSIPLSEGGMLRLDGIELPEHGRRRLGIASSLPNALLARWETLYEDPTAASLHTLYRAPTLLYIKHAQGSPDCDEISAHDSDDHVIHVGGRGQLTGLLDDDPGIWVQDPASSASLANLTLDESPARIIDLCAGRGTKTRQLRAMFPQSEIIACEIDPQRITSLRKFFREDELTRVEHVSEMNQRYASWADLILTDVPCSNTGVLARRLEARYRPIDAQLKRLVETQRSIIAHGYEMLKAGGSMVYATCSVEVEENEANSQWAADTHGLTIEHIQRVEPNGVPGEEACVYRDASFAAVLRRNP